MSSFQYIRPKTWVLCLFYVRQSRGIPSNSRDVFRSYGFFMAPLSGEQNSNRVLSLVDLPLLATNIDASSMGNLFKLSNPSLNTVMEQSQHVYYIKMPNMDKRRTKRDKEKERKMSNGSLQISYSEISLSYQLLLHLKLIFYNLEIYNMI